MTLHLWGLWPRLFAVTLWVCGLSVASCTPETFPGDLVGGSTGTSGTAGNGGDGGQGGSGGMSDCEPTSFTRLQAVEAVVVQATAASQLAGYKTPTSSSYADVAVGDPAFVPAHRAVWLSLLSPAANGSDNFAPNASSDTCFEQVLADGLAALPPAWLVLDSSSDQSVSASSAEVVVADYNFYSVEMTTLDSVRVVNNLSDDDFTSSEPSDALDSVSGVHLGCKDQASGLFNDVSQPLSAAGDATFSGFGCANITGATVVRILADPAQVGAVRLALDPNSVEDTDGDPVIIRGWPKEQSPVSPGTLTVTP